MAKPSDMKSINVTLDYIKRDIQDIKGEIRDIKLEIEKGYVTQIEFRPIKALVYGFAGLVLSAVATALVYLVVTQE